MNSSSNSYRQLSPAEIDQLPKDPKQCRHCAHVMVYAKLPEKLFGIYDKHYALLMQIRFDGTLGFPGGVVDEGETSEEACTRECTEELGVTTSEITITKSDYIVTHYSDHTHFCLHLYAKEVSLDLLVEIEKKTLLSKDWGNEVQGFVRCPLYTFPNGLGFPAFLQHQFIGNARDQLLFGIRHCGLLPEDKIQAALKRSGLINCIVTVENTDYENQVVCCSESPKSSVCCGIVRSMVSFSIIRLLSCIERTGTSELTN